MPARPAGFALLLAALLPGWAAGQNTANLTVVAIVATDPPALAAMEDLRFGTLREGEAVTVDPRSSLSAAKVEIRGASEVDFILDFGLPSLLRSDRGRHTMPVRFGPADACVAARDDQNACAPFNPSASLTRRCPPSGGSQYIWLGGTIIPDGSQAPGIYTGVVTATLRFTGV